MINKNEGKKLGVDLAILERDEYLRRTVESLVKYYQPIQIYLFGSKARGEEGPNSDYDLLVIVQEKVPREKRSGFYDLRWKMGLTQATDIVLFTKEGFEWRLQVKNSLPSVVREEGKLLYAA